MKSPSALVLCILLRSDLSVLIVRSIKYHFVFTLYYKWTVFNCKWMEAENRRYCKILHYMQEQTNELDEPQQLPNSAAENRHGFKLGALETTFKFVVRLAGGHQVKKHHLERMLERRA